MQIGCMHSMGGAHLNAVVIQHPAICDWPWRQWRRVLRRSGVQVVKSAAARNTLMSI